MKQALVQVLEESTPLRAELASYCAKHKARLASQTRELLLYESFSTQCAAPSRKGAAVASTPPGARPSPWLDRPTAANSSSAAASPPASSAARLATHTRAALLDC